MNIESGFSQVAQSLLWPVLVLVGLVVYSVRRRWLLAELLVVRKERGVAQCR